MDRAKHDNRFRTYDPAVGRYISADPIGQEGGVNVYEYASSNPIVRADTLGLTSIQVNFNSPSTNQTIALDQPANFSYQGATFSQSAGQVTITDPNRNVVATFPATSGVPPTGRKALPPGNYVTTGPVVDIPNTKPNVSA